MTQTVGVVRRSPKRVLPFAPESSRRRPVGLQKTPLLSRSERQQTGAKSDKSAQFRVSHTSTLRRVLAMSSRPKFCVVHLVLGLALVLAALSTGGCLPAQTLLPRPGWKPPIRP